MSASDPGRAITQFAHRSWGEEQGYPGLTYAMAQTPDGFLWLGTTGGLYRFDGIRFEHYEPLSGGKPQPGAITSLLALPDGGLWIGYKAGGLSILQNGRIITYGETEGVPGGVIRHIVQDHNGIVWITTGDGLARFDGHRWEGIGAQWNCPKGSATDVFVDSRGTVWAAIGNSVLYLQQGSKRFEDTGEFALQVNSMAEGPDGKVWMADTAMAVRPIGLPGSPRVATARCQAEGAGRGVHLMGPKCNSANQLEIQVGSAGILFDRHGSLWMTTVGDGLLRSPFPLRLKSEPIKEFSDAVEHFTSKEGLSADFGVAVFEDREGNIWVGTRDGLDQFRETALVPVIFPTGTNQISIAPDEKGYIRVISNTNRDARIYGDSLTPPLVASDGYAVYRDPSGTVWVRGISDLTRFQNGRFHVITRLPSLAGKLSLESGGDVQIAGDSSGTLWAFAKNLGFLSLDGRRWEGLKTPPEIARLVPTSAYTDSSGRIWVGFEDGTIATLEKGKITTYEAQEVGLGRVTSIATQGSQIWIGGSRGLALDQGRQFRRILPWDAARFSGVTGIVDTGKDGLWLNEERGVISIPAEEVNKAVQDPSHRVHYSVFDSSDGLPGRTQNQPPYPTAIRGTDGRLWFVAKKGVAWVDPSTIAKNLIAPPVHVTAVSADDSAQSDLLNLRLPPLTGTVHITYTALRFSLPERVRFRYKLDGVDKGWQEAGTRREAFYNHLSPGQYHFHVIASNDDGIWSEQGDTLDFKLLPAWYQTRWFYGLEVLVGISLLWAIYWLRLRQIAHAISARFDERLAERTRIAGDLHDTLLQDFQAVLLNFHTVGHLLPERPAEAVNILQSAISDAQHAITEARNAVQGLRTSSEHVIDLDQALLRVPQELCLEHVADFRVTVQGKPRQIIPAMRDEIYLIAREAISNSFRHTKASCIEVEIEYSPRVFSSRMRDNGGGIDPMYLQSGREGHWGIQGMRERAQRIGARLIFRNVPGSGLEIELSIPGRLVFDSRGHRTK